MWHQFEYIFLPKISLCWKKVEISVKFGTKNERQGQLFRALKSCCCVFVLLLSICIIGLRNFYSISEAPRKGDTFGILFYKYCICFRNVLDIVTFWTFRVRLSYSGQLMIWFSIMRLCRHPLPLDKYLQIQTIFETVLKNCWASNI